MLLVKVCVLHMVPEGPSARNVYVQGQITP